MGKGDEDMLTAANSGPASDGDDTSSSDDDTSSSDDDSSSNVDSSDASDSDEEVFVKPKAKAKAKREGSSAAAAAAGGEKKNRDADKDVNNKKHGAETDAPETKKRTADDLDDDAHASKKSRTTENGDAEVKKDKGKDKNKGKGKGKDEDDADGADDSAIAKVPDSPVIPDKYYVIRVGGISIRAIEMKTDVAWKNKKKKMPKEGHAPFNTSDTVVFLLVVDAVTEIFPGSTANGMARHALLAETRHPVSVSATTTKTTMAVPVFAARAYIRAKFAERCEHMTEGLKHLASIIVTAMTDEDNYHEITRDAFMDISTKKMRARLKPSSKIPSRRYANHLRLAAGAFGASGASGAASASASAAAAAAASATTSSDRLPRSRTTTTNHSAGSYVSATGAGAAAAATVEPTAYRPPSDVTARLMRIVHEIVEITIEINKS